MRIWILFFGVVLFACEDRGRSHFEAFEVFCEMVASEAKPIAFHYPLDAKEVDRAWTRLSEIAQGYDVLLYREESFPETLLFPAAATRGKTIVVIYREPRLEQYQQWKSDFAAADEDMQEAIARRLGRLLGYQPQGINQLLAENSGYDNLALHGVDRQVTHLYYPDLLSARSFYSKTLGLTMIDSNRVRISDDAFLHLHSTDEMHPANQPKSTAIALLTDQLAEWYNYLTEEDVPIKYTYKPKEGGAHDGFVAIDPGGYLLEFEQFKQLCLGTPGEFRPVLTSLNSMERSHGRTTTTCWKCSGSTRKIWVSGW